MEDCEIKEAYEKAICDLKEYYSGSDLEHYLYELELLLNYGSFSCSGFVVDSMISAKHLLFTCSDYESVIKGAISLGNDTDTTAAIAGGLAGTYYGFSSIPLRLINGLRDIARVDGLIELLRACLISSD